MIKIFNPKKLILIVTISALILSDTGCTPATQFEDSSSSDSDTNNTKNSTYTTYIDLALAAYYPELPGWNAVIEAANKKLTANNITIKTNKIPTSTWEPYYQKVLTLIASGNGPDIGRIAESYMPILIQKNQVKEITPRLTEIDTEKYFDNAFKGAAFTNGKAYGVPCGVYTMLLYYNKDLFDQAGLEYPSADWNNPITWNRFREYARKLTNGEGSNKVFGAHVNLGILMLNQYFISNNGKRLFDSIGSSTLHYIKNSEILDMFGCMYRDDKTLLRPVDAKFIGAGDYFRAGRIAMMIEGTWFHSSAKDISCFEPGIAAIPSNTGKSVTTSFVDSWVIYSGTKHENESWEALKAIISKESFDALAPNGVGGIPATKATVEEFNENMIGSKFDKVSQRAFIDSMDHTVSASYSININDFTQDWNYLVEQYSSGKLSTGEFLAKATDTIRKGNVKVNK